MRKFRIETAGNVDITDTEAGGMVRQKDVPESMAWPIRQGFAMEVYQSKSQVDTFMVEIDVPERRLTGMCLTVAGKGDIKIRFSGFIQGEKSLIVMTTALNEIGQGIGITDGGDRAKVTIIS